MLGFAVRRTLTSLRRALVVLLCAVVACLVPGSSFGGHPPSPIGGVPPSSNDPDCPAFDASVLPPAPPAGTTPQAGTIAGTFSVSAAGEATYSFPITVPPGRLGMEPHLSIAYSSVGSDGPMGMGFYLQGISAITRCAANVAQDGYIAPVRYDGTDHFCMSGMRLVPVPHPHKKGQTVEYRTFPDTFARIVAKYGGGISGPLSFEVHAKDGHVLEYGATADSRAMATGGVVAAWHLSSESDRRGNAVDYAWNNDTDPDDGHTREILPAHVDYTRHGSTPATRSIAFDYTPTPASTLYAGGLELTRSNLLTGIRTLVGGSDVVRSLVTGEKVDIPVGGVGGAAFTIQTFLLNAKDSFRQQDLREDTTPRTCPHCHTPGTRFRIVPDGDKLICPACGRSFKP
jgi:hypothetical protein